MDLCRKQKRHHYGLYLTYSWYSSNYSSFTRRWMVRFHGQSSLTQQRAMIVHFDFETWRSVLGRRKFQNNNNLKWPKLSIEGYCLHLFVWFHRGEMWVWWGLLQSKLSPGPFQEARGWPLSELWHICQTGKHVTHGSSQRNKPKSVLL